MFSKASQARKLIPFRTFSTYLVSTPVYYVNANPHIGHLYTLFLAEGVKNVLSAQGHTAYLTTGSDEHGLKIQKMAESKGMTPPELAEKQSAVFRQLFDMSRVDYDIFLRTEEKQHIDLIKEMWRYMVDKGRISLGRHSGYYCTSDESFIPESELDIKGGRGYTALGHQAEFVDEENCLLDFNEDAKEFIRKWLNKEGSVIPNSWVKDLEGRVNRMGPKMSISRPKSLVDWGIRVPGRLDQTVYVWFDALFNYHTVTRRVQKEDPVKLIHVVGKDIAAFQCIYWPTFRYSADLPPPESVLVHGHWVMGGKKMSKSLGNVIDPFTILEKHGPDAFKFYFLTQGPLRADSNYDAEDMIKLHNEFVIGSYFNILLKVMGKNPSTLDLGGGAFNSEQEELFKKVENIVKETRDILKQDFDFVNGFVELRKAADLINNYIDKTDFKNEKDEQALKVFKLAVVRSFLQLTVGVQLFIPQPTQKILKHFSIEVEWKEGEDIIDRQLQDIKSKLNFSVKPEEVQNVSGLEYTQNE